MDRPAWSGDNVQTHGFDQRPYFVRLRRGLHSQSKLLKVPSNSSRVNCPQTGSKPIVGPNVPSVLTVPLMLGATRSKFAWPNTNRPSTVMRLGGTNCRS